MADPFDFLPNDWSYTQKDLWTDAFVHKTNAYYDPVAQALYNEAFFNWDAREGEVSALQKALRDYMDDVYGLDLDRTFDWDAWREAYDGEAA